MIKAGKTELDQHRSHTVKFVEIKENLVCLVHLVHHSAKRRLLSDINVSQGTVAADARCGWSFNSQTSTFQQISEILRFTMLLNGPDMPQKCPMGYILI